MPLDLPKNSGRVRAGGARGCPVDLVQACRLPGPGPEPRGLKVGGRLLQTEIILGPCEESQQLECMCLLLLPSKTLPTGTEGSDEKA